MVSQTLEKLEQFKEVVASKQPNVELQPLDFSQVSFDTENKKIKVGELTFGKNAINKVYNMLAIKKTLPQKFKKTSENHWKEMENVLRKFGNTQGLYAEINKNKNQINSIKTYNDSKSVDAQINENLAFVESVITNLRLTNNDLECTNLVYDSETNIIKMDFINPNSEFEALSNWKGLKSDSWKMGFSFEKDSYETKLNNFFFRLVCTNGMTTKEFGNGSTFKNSVDAYDIRIEKQIGKLFGGYDSDVVRDIQTKCLLLSKNNLSVNEYQHIWNILNDLSDNEDYQILIQDKFVNFDQISEFYDFKGYNLRQQSTTWMKTANSGVNAYDTFNSLTEISSHADTYSQLDQRDANQIQMLSQNLFFGKLDLAEIAKRFEPVFN